MQRVVCRPPPPPRRLFLSPFLPRSPEGVGLWFGRTSGRGWPLPPLLPRSPAEAPGEPGRTEVVGTDRRRGLGNLRPASGARGNGRRDYTGSDMPAIPTGMLVQGAGLEVPEVWGK